MALSLQTADEEAESLSERRTILVVDDDTQIREMLQDCLEEYGFSVLTATDGVEACALFMKESARIDLVVSDMLMPKMNGFYAYKVMCRVKPGLKAILVSGYPNGVKMAGDGNINIPEFMSKPISPKGLIMKIQEMLDNA
ncbi:MAG: response regulator [Oryzomonas sp.]|uniref:response regulator n=1 Tax=Oryzomonas sp. TaxID=2855186 RepID=UPI0028422BA2|nr:response regulator [Oryzomonas sp.]MDR3578574.1 response regulator [Oryzomonas sp.]